MPQDRITNISESDLRTQLEREDYETLLRRWRFAPSGDPVFEGAAGEIYKEIMFRKRDEHPNPAAVSKRVGWK